MYINSNIITDYINTDNMIFEKVWDDYNGYNNLGDYFQINVTAYNAFVRVDNFNFYMDANSGKKLSKLISKYVQDNKTMLYEYKKSVDNNEIMSIRIELSDIHGHVIIYLKIENSNNTGNKNYAELFIETELGLLENFGKKILELIRSGVGYKISLNKELD